MKLLGDTELPQRRNLQIANTSRELQPQRLIPTCHRRLIKRAGSSDPARRPIKKLSNRPLILEPINNFTTSKTY